MGKSTTSVSMVGGLEYMIALFTFSGYSAILIGFGNGLLGRPVRFDSYWMILEAGANCAVRAIVNDLQIVNMILESTDDLYFRHNTTQKWKALVWLRNSTMSKS
jgi:hypothetical protein